MKEAHMIYGDSDKETIWGIPLETKIVEAEEVDGYVATGKWYRHPFELRDAREAAVAQQQAEQEVAAEQEETDERAKLLSDAAALGIEVDGRWGNKRLAEEIAKRGEHGND